MKKLLSSIVVISIMLFSVTAFAGYVWFDFNGDQIADTGFSLQVGEDFDVDIYVSEISTTYTMGFDFTFDPAQVSYNSSTIGTNWPYQPEILAGTGTLQFAAGTALGASVSGDSILLASINFSCLAAGVSNFETLKSNRLGVGFFGNNPDLNDTMIWASASIEQNAVPIPGAFILLGSGLLGLLAVRRRKT